MAPFACDRWFDGIEWLALELKQGLCDHEGFVARLAALGRPCPDGAYDPALCRSLLEERAGPLPPAASLWWTLGDPANGADGDTEGGAEGGAAALVACDGLPEVVRLAAMLDDGWRRWAFEEDGA